MVGSSIHFFLAKATAAEVFKSVQDSVGDTTNKSSGTSFVVVLLGAAALVLLLSLSSLRFKREAKQKMFNHLGKLLKEVCKRISLRPAEIKQLKLLVANRSEEEKPIVNPLVMVLCPSVLAKSLRKPPVKLDRKVIAGLARKMGLTVTSAKAKR